VVVVGPSCQQAQRRAHSHRQRTAVSSATLLETTRTTRALNVITMDAHDAVEGCWGQLRRRIVLYSTR
jgi:hypothetical protein